MRQGPRASAKRDGLRRTALALLAAVLLAVPAPLLGVGGVYTSTKHGNPTTGVYRDTSWNRGECAQCHLGHPGNPFALFTANDNTLCYTSGCHSTPSPLGVYQGPTTYDASAHRNSSSMVWPGADATVDASAPRARMSADWGKCINCHDPHGYNMDGTGLIPNLLFSREEKVCYVCHDGSPARTNVKLDFGKAVRHPVVNTDTLRRPGRSVECGDCHNSHAAQGPVHNYSTTATVTRNQIANPGNPAKVLSKVSGVQFNWTGLANWGVPGTGNYTAIPPSPGATYEYEICLKCHSSYSWGTGTPPTGISTNGGVTAVETDTAQEFNPNNKSGHPVVTGLDNYPNSVAVGTTPRKGLQTTAMTAPWNVNVGQQTMMCSDCHNSDASSPAAQGPHGSAAQFMLRGANSSNWPNVTLANRNTSWCANCHNLGATQVHTKGDHSSYQCYRCHVVVPHGSKMSRLIADRDGTMPPRYAYQNAVTNVYVTSFTKASSYDKNNCRTSCGEHSSGSSATMENW